MIRMIRQTMRKPEIQVLLYLIMTAFSLPSSGADTDPPPLFQVDLILFAHLGNSYGPDVEKWPKNITLTYPDNVQLLIDPYAPIAPVNEFEPLLPPGGSFVSDTSTSNNATYDSDDTEGRAPTSIDLGAETLNDTNEPLPTKRDGLITEDLPAFFTYLEPEQRLLNKEAKALSYRKDKRTLFHQSWIQPMLDQDDAPALIIQAGDQFSDHHEVEGSITLHVSRYLHLNTDLWFIEFTPNIGQTPEYWPIIPKISMLNFSEPSPEPFVRLDLNEDTSTDTLSLGNFATNQSFDAWPYGQTWRQQPYLVKQIATMRQKRRIRSGELHYVDHPKLGVLIKIEPYKNDELN